MRNADDEVDADPLEVLLWAPLVEFAFVAWFTSGSMVDVPCAAPIAFSILISLFVSKVWQYRNVPRKTNALTYSAREMN
jgi:hypothetical protein